MIDKKTFVVSIAGGHGTGVYELSLRIKDDLKVLFKKIKIDIVNLDDLIIDPEHRKYNDKDYAFEDIYEKLTHCIVGKNIEKADTERGGEDVKIIILCGSYALYNIKINEISKLKVYLDDDSDQRLINLISMNGKKTADEQNKAVTAENDKEMLSKLLHNYLEHLRPEMQKYIEPTKIHSDLIIPNQTGDEIGVAIIVDGIVKIIEKIKHDGIRYPVFNNKVLPEGSSPSPPLWDFEAEMMDVEKDRYYDLA
ncbi:putative uridine kinase DAS2 NDAI_0A05870 [Naumovozyma dairenensis CBS 421]|uniref:Phosphoribulokinase/uridine kinase domain-containing protein n=1 Tax=Naumovozyma dairenensis (strain ATCC 10597 / BCRC 20456 / CBS 421 / NBRC 0211 / NRRL Y-12639) TaxID=1071378 RepID=G0W4K4_NAUDC|nr:hypothetical protein NDAI_0A05870 [Naumovozyma dairenensis CBS 421]CCD22742.1 hypothetical protein NDAI_0A05870 [Naumovozyma dairenensis CBS 421]